MRDNKMKVLKNYIKYGDIPILTSLITKENITSPCVVSAKSNIEEITEKIKVLALNKERGVLVIDNIDDISKIEQLKFISLLKKYQITMNSYNNCCIVFTAKKITWDTISEELYSLVLHI